MQIKKMDYKKHGTDAAVTLESDRVVCNIVFCVYLLVTDV